KPPPAKRIRDAAHHVRTHGKEPLIVHFDRLIQRPVKSIAYLSLFAAEPVNDANSDGGADRYLQVLLRPDQSCGQGNRRQQNCVDESAVSAAHNQSSFVPRNRITASSAFQFGMRVYPIRLLRNFTSLMHYG